MPYFALPSRSVCLFSPLEASDFRNQDAYTRGATFLYAVNNWIQDTILGESITLYRNGFEEHDSHIQGRSNSGSTSADPLRYEVFLPLSDTLYAKLKDSYL